MGPSYDARNVIVASVAAIILFLSTMTAASAQTLTKLGDKWITMVLPSEPPDLDGCNSIRVTMGRVIRQNIVETLIEKTPSDGSLKPRLATSWEQIDDTDWRIKLREGVTFHDGSPLDAAAVKKSLDRTINNKSIVCADKGKAFGDFVSDISIVDDHTIQIRTSRPEPILPMRLTGPAIVGPNTPTDKIVLDPVGTGPYVLDRWQAGQQILLKRNERYWGAKPEVEGIRYIWRNESSVRAAMVAVGEADIGQAIAAKDAIDPNTDFGYLNSETTSLRIDMTQPPLNDRRVRLALNYAVDRESMRLGLHSKDTLHATQLVMPSIPGHNFEIDKKILPYDPAKAKQLLAEAKADGVPIDREILMLGRPYGYPEASEEMEAILATYTAIGLNVKLSNLEQGQLAKWSTKPFPENRGANLVQVSHDNNSGDPVFTVFYRYACDGNQSTFCDPAFDKDVARVTALSGDARVKGWQEIFRHLYEDVVPDVWMFHMLSYIRVSPRIQFRPDVTTNNEIRVQEITFK